jgi:murein DD-endopeptidase MepM/ murein hydrolase activator NlpD
VPIIDPNSPELVAARKALPATQPAPAAAAAAPAAPEVPQASSVVAWPLHGTITTLFGVPELPYQAIHTGLDISDGKRPGTTPIKAFRQGKVLQTLTTGGLGNHVIVDHGNGVTSVYGHLNSISVQVGQTVDTTTILGYEGTTGVSTGSHLHFEIRVNGQATDPHQFISGQP